MSVKERTFIMIKPDGVQRNKSGAIIKAFEARGFKLVAMKMAKPSQAHFEEHYAEHKGRDFFERLVGSIQKGPVLAMVWEGDQVVATGRKLIGATFADNREPGTLRGAHSNST